MKVNVPDQFATLGEFAVIQRSIVAAVIFLIKVFLSREPAAGDFENLFTGKDLNGWKIIGGELSSWSVVDGVLHSTGTGGWLSTTDQFHNFELNLEFRTMTKAANSGVFLRTPQVGKPSVEGLEVQLLDEDQDRYKDLQPYQYTGGLYHVTGPSSRISKPVGEWQEVNISCVDRKVRVAVNHITTVDVDLDHYKDQVPSHPGLLRSSGCVGLQSLGGAFEYRNIRLRKLPSDGTQIGKNSQANRSGDKEDEAATAARRAALLNSYGTFAANLRTTTGTRDLPRLVAELDEMHATSYNWLISGESGGVNDWDDLQKFLPVAKEHGIRVWATVWPPSESPPKKKYFSEPFRLDYERWAGELAELSTREPALVAWSIDDYAQNAKTFTPDRMSRIIAIQREKNPNFAFVPCVYYKRATPEFVSNYRDFLDGILFPYRSESTEAGLSDATQVRTEVNALRDRFGRDFPIVVDVYASRHSAHGASTPEYVDEVMKRAYEVADGVSIYCHQDKDNRREKAKSVIIRRNMSLWARMPVRSR